MKIVGNVKMFVNALPKILFKSGISFLLEQVLIILLQDSWHTESEKL